MSSDEGQPLTGTRPAADPPDKPPRPQINQSAKWIAMGLLLGIACGVFFGDYCAILDVFGRAYVGLLQMTVLPYLVVSLISKLGRLNLRQARQLGMVALATLLVFWGIGILVIVVVSAVLPPVDGAEFFSPDEIESQQPPPSFVRLFIPTNVFRSLVDEAVPAVVVFALFCGAGLILVPQKEPLLEILDLCTAMISRINFFLIRLAPFGLFALTAAAAGTMYTEDLFRLQAYLIMFTLACGLVAFGVLPMLVSGLTEIRYGRFLKASEEPLLTALATGKLFVVLPQIVEKCELLLEEVKQAPSDLEHSTPSVLVPLAYPFPHLGKIMGFVFISFAAWYVGRGLAPHETTAMAATGAVTSFASPLITIPFLLDLYRLPQDLMPLYLLPGFLTMRLADMVGVIHLMTLSLIVSQTLAGRLRVRWSYLGLGTAGLATCLLLLGLISRAYLSSTELEYKLDQRIMALELPTSRDDIVVYASREDVPERPKFAGSTLDRLKSERVLRAGFLVDHMPYSFYNSKGDLIGLDVEMLHQLTRRLGWQLEFVPCTYQTVVEQLYSGEIDVAVGGLLMTPDRMLKADFTQPYQKATLAVVVPDYRREQLKSWQHPGIPPQGLRLGVISNDLANAARSELPANEIVSVPSIREFFRDENGQLDGLIIPAEEGAWWTILYPEHTVVIPEPVVERPIAMAVRTGDVEWLHFLNRWVDFERLDGSLERLRKYWVEGGGTRKRAPRWSVIRNVLHWVPDAPSHAATTLPAEQQEAENDLDPESQDRDPAAPMTD